MRLTATDALGEIIMEVAAELLRQDSIHPDGFPASRDGIRLALATADDELREALDAWRDGRCKCPTPRCAHHNWNDARGEMIQAVAVLLRSLVSIDANRGITWDLPELADGDPR